MEARVALLGQEVAVKYEDALRVWGASKLKSSWNVGPEDKIDLATVVVEMNFDEGYSCCGGSDPDCYCSMAESPSASVEISGMLIGGGAVRASIEASCFDFAAVLGEIVAAGEGTLNA